MNRHVYEKAREFIFRNARPLDLCRWKYHFEGGGADAVLEALAAYQNPDGGFANALEADCWDPSSSPIQTWCATEILREVGCTDTSNPLLQGILHYLGSGAAFTGSRWLNGLPTHSLYPHAPWWGDDDGSSVTYNPTACLAGFAVRFAERGSALRELGCRVAVEAYDAYMKGELLDDMHIVSCYIRLLDYCSAAGDFDLFDLSALERRLVEQVAYSVTRDTSRWPVDYVCKPSQFFIGRDSVFYPVVADIAEYEREFIEGSQLPDGSWPVTWNWSEYPEQWAVAKNWWRSDIVIRNTRLLKAMDS